jgi:hypothetical protein
MRAETKNTIGTLVGVGVAFGLLGGMLFALDRAQRSAPPPKGGGGSSGNTGKGGSGGGTTIDPWANLKTQLQLLELQTNSLSQLSSYILPAVHQIGLDSDQVKAAGQAIAFGPSPPPATSAQLVPLGQALGKLVFDAPAASTFDQATATAVASVVAQANAVVAAATSALPGGQPGVAGWGPGAQRGGSTSQGAQHGGGYSSGGAASRSAVSNGGTVAQRSAAQGGSAPSSRSAAQRQAEAMLFYMLNPPPYRPPR